MLKIAYIKNNPIDTFKIINNSNYNIVHLNIQISLDNVLFISDKKIINSKLLTNLYFYEIIELDDTIISLNTFFESFHILNSKLLLQVNVNNRFVCAFLNKILTKYKNFDKILIVTNNIFILESMHRFNENYNLGLMTKNIVNEEILLYYIQKFNITFVCFHWSVLCPETIKYLHKNNIMIFGYKSKNNHMFNIMKEYNLTGIISDVYIFTET